MHHQAESFTTSSQIVFATTIPKKNMNQHRFVIFAQQFKLTNSTKHLVVCAYSVFPIVTSSQLTTATVMCGAVFTLVGVCGLFIRHTVIL